MSITFYSIGDFGNPTPEVIEVAKAMDVYARTHPPNFILGLGDNFYPAGVMSVSDQMFKKYWADVFLVYESLRVPWHIILGNHDYINNPEAQIEYTYSTKNTSRLWNMPDYFYKLKLRAGSEEGDHFNVDFFALDTNGCQGHVQHSNPETIPRLRSEKDWLNEQLIQSNAHWKIVFGHHPMYTKGKGHGSVARCLRDTSYTYRRYNRTTYQYDILTADGFGMEEVLINNNVDLYISGHEHVFQHHKNGGVQHVVCGNSGADIRPGTGFYDGEDKNVSIDWMDHTNSYGFMAFHVTSSNITIDVINSRGESFEQIIISKN